MKRYILVALLIIATSVTFADVAFPTELPNKELTPDTYSVKEMKYHSTPAYYFTLTGSNWCLACWFRPSDFGVANNPYRIIVIGMMGYSANGAAKIYVTAQENDSKPRCNPDNSFQYTDFGPLDWHINNTYPNYDDITVYNKNWYYKKTDFRFWVIYYLPTSPPPYPISDGDDNKDTLTWNPTSHTWIDSIQTYKVDWCMHVLIEYPPTNIENTSIGTIRALFK